MRACGIPEWQTPLTPFALSSLPTRHTQTMTRKNIVLSIAALMVAFGSGYYAAGLAFKRHLNEYEKRVSAISRSRGIGTLAKEIEALVLSFERSSGLDEKVHASLCKIISSKLEQIDEDRAVVESGLATGGDVHEPGIVEAHNMFTGIADRELAVSRDHAKRIGCP